MKRILFLVPGIFLIAFFSCNESSPGKALSGSSDSSSAVVHEIPKIDYDSIPIDLEKSSFNCTRSKEVKHVNQQVMLFGKPVNVQMENASFSASVVIKILRANWFLSDHKFDGGKIILDMKSISTMQVGKNKELEMATPDYLDAEKYPLATFQITQVDT